jgi:hypothetical protein
MVGVDNIIKILELVVFSGHIKGEQPVSAVVASLPEAGKTEMIMKLMDNEGCLVLTDVTAYGIMKDYAKRIAEKEIRHIIIPDLIKPMSRGKDTVHSLIAFLNCLLEEGVMKMSTYAMSVGVPSEGMSVSSPTLPIKCGLITAMAKEVLLDGRHGWARMGFMSRLLPVSYGYNVNTQLSIHKSIAERQYQSEAKIKLNLPKEDIEVKLDIKEADALMILSTALSSIGNKANPQKVYGFRLQKILQRLAMANAISEVRDTVEEKDVEVIRQLAVYMNLDFNPL